MKTLILESHHCTVEHIREHILLWYVYYTHTLVVCVLYNMAILGMYTQIWHLVKFYVYGIEGLNCYYVYTCLIEGLNCYYVYTCLIEGLNCYHVCMYLSKSLEMDD